jgi:hypothetical protein
MKTTKLILAILTLLMTIASVSAFTMPHPVYGVITNDGNAVANAQVKYENIVTGKIEYTNTDNKGFYQFELANVDEGYRSTDTIRLSLVACSSSVSCSKTSTLGGGVTQLTFDLIDMNVFPDPIVTDCTTTTCPTCSGCVCTPTQCDTVVCPTCPVVPACDVCNTCAVCPEQKNDNLTTLIASVITLLLGGGAVYIAQGTKKAKVQMVNGVAVVTHKHPLSTSYHSINTMHNNEPHKKGEIYPNYVKVDGVYKYKG